MKKSLAALLPLMLLLFVTGCRHRAEVVVAPAPQHPKPRAHKPRAALVQAPAPSLPLIPASAPPQVVLGGAVEPAPPRRPAYRHTEEHPQDSRTTPSTANNSATSGEEPSATTPIGQFSAAPNTQGLPSKSRISHSIASLERQLNGIHRALSAPEQNTADQIRTFLAKATNALQAGDLDGANTLTIKASVLLNELK